MTNQTALAERSAILPGASLETRLRVLQEVSHFDESVVEEFQRYLETAADEHLYRANPFMYATVTGLSERRALDLFLYATHVGIFEIQWGVLCPGCAAFITTPGGLRSLHTEASCMVCDEIIPVEADDGVEVAFTVAPQVRSIRFHQHETMDLDRDWDRVFFTGNKVMDPEYRAAFEALPVKFGTVRENATDQMKVVLSKEDYLLSAPRHHAYAHVKVEEGGPTEFAFELLDGRIVPETAVVGPGAVTLHVRNRIGQAALYGLIRNPSSAIMPLVMAASVGGVPQGDACMVPGKRPYTLLPFATGKHLANSQVFRDLFRADSIPSELGVSFKSVTFLFTDLKGSTALYGRMGDVKAYQLVKAHFALLRDIIAEMGGAVVKTMGDAVMASFASPLSALEAAILMHREIEKLGLEEGLILKIGLHSGPCIAVESNDRLDYFGQTVNTAARVQGIAGAGELVLTDAIYQTPGAIESLRSAGLTSNCEVVQLRGMENTQTVYRVVDV